MRILHLIPCLSGGGAERQLGYLASYLANQGHEIHIGYLYDGPQAGSFGSVTLHRLSARSSHDPLLFSRIFRIVRSISPDIVQTWLLQMDILGGTASKLAGVPWVLREASCGFGYDAQPTRDSQALKRFLRILVASTAGGIIANSRGGIEYWDRYYPGRIKTIIPNGFPLALTNSVQAALADGIGVSAETKIVLTVGRFAADKRFFSRLTDVIPMVTGMNIHFVILGGGPMLREAMQKVSALGLTTYVTFLGQVPPEHVIQWMRRSDLFCFISEYEGFPNVLAEAVLCNCPVVLSDIPAHRDLLDENCGFFVDHRNPGEIAEGITTMLKSPGRASEMAQRAWCRMKEFTIPQMTAKYEDAYTKILDGLRDA